MSTARHHNEWLSLVEVSGPFLSLPVLLRAFPQGLCATIKRELRQEPPAQLELWPSQEREQLERNTEALCA